MESALIVVIASHNRARMKNWANTVIDLKAGSGTQMDVKAFEP